MRPSCRALGAALFLTAAAPRPAIAERLATPVDELGPDVARAFTGTNLLYYGTAVALTAVMVPTGADHGARVAFQENVHAPGWGEAAYYGGYLLPLTIAPGVYLAGLVARDPGLAGAGSAAVQALGVTFVTTLVLKVGTGRPFPLHGGDPNAPDRLSHPEYAREFVPFGLHGRYAWPSGHTSATVSVAAALTAYTGDSALAIAYPVALGVGVGMVVRDSHWVSDFLAGALVGQAIGWSVGTSFRERAAPSRRDGARWTLVPLLGDVRGLALCGRF